MNDKPYSVGSGTESWGGDSVQSLGFIVTEDCNLRCKYCYITHKTSGKVLKFDTAKKFIDFVLTTDQIERKEAVILEFIGGEPLLEPELIDQICDYFKLKTYEIGHPWYWNYRISISTNGVNYSDKRVQKFIEKNEGKISLGITIDGTKEKHDLQRVFPDGSGSYDIIHENIELWLKQFPGDTKVTFASEDLKLLKDSIIQLWEEGIPVVSSNVVFENVWKEGDDDILESQLKELADYIIENNLYDKYQCTFFDDNIGMPYEKEMLFKTSCGAGKMMELAPNGDIYPCMRYYDYSLNHKKGYVVGNVDTGINKEKTRVFETVMYKYQSDDECLKCEIATGCSFCQGFNYDEADTVTNFQRAKYICKMHKARVRANNYYFTRLFHERGIKREGGFYFKRSLLFILSDDSVSLCSYDNSHNKSGRIMSKENIIEGLKYAEKNFMRPVFIYSRKAKGLVHDEMFRQYDILHIIPASCFSEEIKHQDYRLVFDEVDLEQLDCVSKQDNVFLNIQASNVNRLFDYFKKVIFITDRINLNVNGVGAEFELIEYENSLKKIKEFIVQYYKENNVLKEISVLTDILFIEEHQECKAGEDMFTYGGDGRFYLCPAFYFEQNINVGNPTEGIQVKNQHLLTQRYAPICNYCDAYQCENCKYINQLHTGEVNVSPSFQCKKAHIERRVSLELGIELRKYISNLRELKSIDYEDPIFNLRKQGTDVGYYR